MEMNQSNMKGDPTNMSMASQLGQSPPQSDLQSNYGAQSLANHGMGGPMLMDYQQNHSVAQSHYNFKEGSQAPMLQKGGFNQ
jgi:hypothetical protein